jgi:hypothetical protein
MPDCPPSSLQAGGMLARPARRWCAQGDLLPLQRSVVVPLEFVSDIRAAHRAQYACDIASSPAAHQAARAEARGAADHGEEVMP